MTRPEGQNAASTPRLGTLTGPALAVAAGIDLPFERQKGDRLPLRDELHPRADFEPGICGAKWLRSRADKASSALQSKGCSDHVDESDE